MLDLPSHALTRGMMGYTDSCTLFFTFIFLLEED